MAYDNVLYMMNRKGLGRSSADEFQGHIMVSPRSVNQNKPVSQSTNKQTHKQTYTHTIHTYVYCFILSFPHVNMKFKKFPFIYKEKISACFTGLL